MAEPEQFANDGATSGDALVQQLFAYGSEANVDYKVGMHFPSDGRGRAKLAKHVMGMANKQDGGYLLIGVEDTTRKATALTSEQLGTWDLAKVAAAFSGYMSPSAVLDIQQGLLETGELVLGIRVAPFAEQPVICTRTVADEAGKTIIREGALYIRTGNSETKEISSEGEMRELLERAYVKKADHLLATIKELIDAHWPQSKQVVTEALTRLLEADFSEMELPRDSR